MSNGFWAVPFDGSAAAMAVSAVVAVVAAVRGVWSPCGLSMIAAINPMTERSRGNRYWLTACWYVVGALVGGAVLGAGAALGAGAFGLLGVGPGVVAVLAAFCCLVTAAADTEGVPVTLPLHPRQVNERWLSRYRRWIYASGFGIQIGSGFATYIMTAAVYLTAALAILSGAPWWALALGLVFGAVRGSAVVLTARIGDGAALMRLHRTLAALTPVSVRVAIAVQLAAAPVLMSIGAGGTAAAFVVLPVAVIGTVAWRSGRAGVLDPRPAR